MHHGGECSLAFTDGTERNESYVTRNGVELEITKLMLMCGNEAIFSLLRI